jgi:hypothetical protein
MFAFFLVLFNFSWLLTLFQFAGFQFIRNSIVLTVRLMLSSFSGNLSATDEGPCREALTSFQSELWRNPINKLKACLWSCVYDVSLNLCPCRVCFWWSFVVVVSSWIGKPMCKLSRHISYPLLPDLYVCYRYLCDAFYFGTKLIKSLC